jgi:hypothetical protein
MNSNKKKKVCLLVILSFVFCVFFLVFYSSSKGVSFYTKQSFYFNHNQNIHLNKIKYELVQLRPTDQFGSFYEVKLSSQKDVHLLESLFQSDPKVNKYSSVLDDTYSLEVFNLFYEIQDLPFDLDCDCYAFYTINERSMDGGYLYQIFMYEENVYIYFTSR